MELVEKLGEKLDEVKQRIRWRANLTHKSTDDLSYLMDRIDGYSGWINELMTIILNKEDSLLKALMDTNPDAMNLGYSECKGNYIQSMTILNKLRIKFLEIVEYIIRYEEEIKEVNTQELKEVEATKLLYILNELDVESYYILKEMIDSIRAYYDCAVKPRARVFTNNLTKHIINYSLGGSRRYKKNKRNTKKRSRTVRSKRA
jgi:hypothetical protein